MESKYVAGTPEIAHFDFSRLNQAGADKTQKRIELAAEYFWNSGLGDHGTPETPDGPAVIVLFTDLTKRQKLDIIAQYFERVINDAARTTNSNKAQDAARSAADADFNSNN